MNQRPVFLAAVMWSTSWISLNVSLDSEKNVRSSCKLFLVESERDDFNICVHLLWSMISFNGVLGTGVFKSTEILL